MRFIVSVKKDGAKNFVEIEALGTFSVSGVAITVSIIDGKISLPRTYKCQKYLPRKCWNNDVPILLSKGEWSKGLTLLNGIVEFDILGDILRIEAEE